MSCIVISTSCRMKTAYQQCLTNFGFFYRSQRHSTPQILHHNKLCLCLLATKAFETTDISSQQILPLLTGHQDIRPHRYFSTTNFCFVCRSQRHSTPQIFFHKINYVCRRHSHCPTPPQLPSHNARSHKTHRSCTNLSNYVATSHFPSRNIQGIVPCAIMQYISFPLALQPNAGHGRLILDVSR